jgi:RNA polymerase sigma-70 factor (ECF subfamily)
MSVTGTSFAIDVPQAVIQRMRSGDMRAYEQVYRLFERPVYTLAWRLLGDPDEAREILHDAMLTLFDRLDQFRGEAPFWGWLRQIAVNEALMRLRKRRLDYVDELPEPSQAATPVADAALEGGDLERALATLSPLTRTIVWLYYVEGYTHEEIAASFDRSVSFSKSQVSRGTQRLRENLNHGKEQYAYA